MDRRKTGRGYGSVKAEDGRQPVHRVVYELLIGPIPDGLVSIISAAIACVLIRPILNP